MKGGGPAAGTRVVATPEADGWVQRGRHSRATAYHPVAEGRYRPKQVKATITASIQYWEAVARL